MGESKTVLVALYRQGEEGKGKPADIFMRRAVASATGNPYAFGNFVPGAQNVSSVTPTELWQNPFDSEKPEKMLRWAWSPANLADSSAKQPAPRRKSPARSDQRRRPADRLQLDAELGPSGERQVRLLRSALLQRRPGLDNRSEWLGDRAQRGLQGPDRGPRHSDRDLG